MKIQVYLGVVRHKYGLTTYVGRTLAEVNAKLYTYVEEWWAQFCDDAPLPKNHEDAICAYFEAACDVEYLDMSEDELEVDG